MSEILTIIEEKFETAWHLYAAGKDALRSSQPPMGPKIEGIALDSLEGPDSRCLLTRGCIGLPGLDIYDLDILSTGREIPRTEGDRRRLEDLPPEAIHGNIFAIGTRNDGEIEIKGDIRPDWLSADGLGAALSGMRVAESIPFTSH